MTAFSDALDRLFTDPHLSAGATYRAGGTGTPKTVRVILRRPDRLDTFGATAIVSETLIADVRVGEVPALAEGDTFEIDGTTYRVQGEPVRGAGRLWWTAELAPA